MSKASIMEEDYDWNNLRSVQGLFKVYNAPLRLTFRGRLVNPVKEARGSVNMIKGENPINWDGVGLESARKEESLIVLICLSEDRSEDRRGED